MLTPGLLPTTRPGCAYLLLPADGQADFLAGLVIHDPLPDPTDEGRHRLNELAAFGSG